MDHLTQLFGIYFISYCDQQSRTEQCMLGNHTKFDGKNMSCHFSTVKIHTHAYFSKKKSQQNIESKKYNLIVCGRKINNATLFSIFSFTIYLIIQVFDTSISCKFIF